MAGVLLQWLALEDLVQDLNLFKVGIQCDNSSTVHWSQKFYTLSLCAGHLIRALALIIKTWKCAPLMVAHIAGDDNKMADVASRFKLDSSLYAHSTSLLHYFNSHFPQATSWQQFHLPSNLISRVISSLWGQRLTLELWRRLPKPGKSTGTTGLVTQMLSTSTLASEPVIPSSMTCASQHSLLGSGQAATARDIKSKFKESLKPWWPPERSSQCLASPTQYIVPPQNTTSQLKYVWKGCGARICQWSLNLQSQ